jgi:hypothetical protein
MAKPNVPLLAFNRGEIGKHALGRIDVDELRLAAQTQVNWMPLAVGPMMLRPGLQFIGKTHLDSAARLFPFVFSAGDTAILELTDSLLRFWVNDALLTAPSVSTTVSSGDFSSSAGWTLTNSPGSEATIAGGTLLLECRPIGGSATADQLISVAPADRDVVHRLRIVVARGPITFQAGFNPEDDDVIAKVDLGTGMHSIAFTPADSFYVRFTNETKFTRSVDSIQVEAAGTVTLPTPWLAADLPLIRYDQSGDVIYVACSGYQPRKIERRDNNSWSIVLFEQGGGPYTAKPIWAGNILMEPQLSLGGTIRLIASADYFTDDHVNSLIAINTRGNNTSESVAGSGFFSKAVKVSGVDAVDRAFEWQITGTFVGTVTLQRSVEGPNGGFVDVEERTANDTVPIDDSSTHANVDAWYRFGFKSGDYTSGAAEGAILYTGGGSGRGEGRIVTLFDATEVDVEMLDDFDNDAPTTDWEISDWSESLGWPSCCKLHEGRLFFAGRDKVWASVSDDYENFDVTFEGEAGPINRSFGYGAFNRVNDLMALSRLIAFREMSETSIRSSNFDVPLTPTDFTAKDCSTQGSYPLAPVKVDTRGIFVEKSGRRVMELAFSAEKQDYDVRDLTRFNHDIGEEGFVDIAVQRQPDTRIHFIRGDGTAAVLSYDHVEGIEAWWRIETDGEIESVCVLPGAQEDDVYYVVKRTIDGDSVRYLEKLAHQSECIGGPLNKQADSFLSISQASSATITGLSHLEGETVVVWANGKDLGTYAVSGGQVIGLSEAVTTAIVGLTYEARFQSAKLAYGALKGTALFQKKRAIQVGLMLTDTHYQGIRFGQDFDHLKNLPLVEDGKATPENTVWSEFDAPMIPLSGNWQTDARLCLTAAAPRPVCVIACAVMLDTQEK